MVFLKKCINVYKKGIEKVQLINHDCLPILMLLYVMLYIMLAYIMLFVALSNSVCLNNDFCMPLIFENAFIFMLCLGLLTHFVYLKYAFASRTVHLICWFFLILCSCRFVCFFVLMNGLCALSRNST